MKAIRFAAGLLLGATLISTSSIATAQDFPKGPIKLIVPVPAGGGVDLLSRTHRTEDVDQSRRSGRGREQTGCERRDRHRGAREVAARRLHDHDGVFGARDESDLQSAADVRRRQGFHADRLRRLHPADSRHASAKRIRFGAEGDRDRTREAGHGRLSRRAAPVPVRICPASC